MKWLALFLAGMPFIYLVRWILNAGMLAGRGGLMIELGGVLLYSALAVVGLRRYWFLAGGIAAHGIGWDIWHYYPRQLTFLRGTR